MSDESQQIHHRPGWLRLVWNVLRRILQIVTAAVGLIVSALLLILLIVIALFVFCTEHVGDVILHYQQPRWALYGTEEYSEFLVGYIWVLVGLFAIGILAGGIGLAMSARTLIQRVLGLVMLYFALILLFGFVHWGIYASSNSKYHFSDWAIAGLRDEKMSNLDQRMERCLREKEVIAAMHQHPIEVMQALHDDDGGQIDSNIQLHRSTGHWWSADRHKNYEIVVEASGEHYQYSAYFDDSATSVGIDSLLISTVPDQVHKALSSIETGIASRIAGLQRDIKKLNQVGPSLGLREFVYFSCVSMTTVGYGEIVPNHSDARAIVFIQSVVGVCYIAYAIILFRPVPLLRSNRPRRVRRNGTPKGRKNRLNRRDVTR